MSGGLGYEYSLMSSSPTSQIFHSFWCQAQLLHKIHRLATNLKCQSVIPVFIYPYLSWVLQAYRVK